MSGGTVPMDFSEARVSVQFGIGSQTGGTRDYERLKNKPQINGVELSGQLTLDDLGISKIPTMELLDILR